MKKIALMIAALGSVFAFTACNESKDDHPVANPLPAEGVHADFLNIPEMTNATISFTPQIADGYVHMTCSQPDYGYAAPVCYQVEVSFDELFTTPKVAGAPASVTLNTAFYDCSEINPVNRELAGAICDLLGVQDESGVPTPYYQLYMRLQANIQSVTGELMPNTNYISNTVSIKSVNCAYLAISIPDEPTGIYLRGDMNGWGAEADWQFLTTKEFDVYTLKAVSIPEGTTFKVADSSWGEIDLGAGGNLEFKKAYKLVAKGANIVMPADFNGSVTLKKKGANYTITFTPFED